MMSIIAKPLIHANERPVGTAVDTIIIHSLYAKDQPEPVSIAACFSVLDACQVSAHYLISRDGEIWRLVDEEKRAWHAGVSKMPFSEDGRENVNHFSIGIELIATEESGFTDLQYEALTRLTLEIIQRHPIKSILGHEHVAPGRKVDPGPLFDWARYRSSVEAGTQITLQFPA